MKSKLILFLFCFCSLTVMSQGVVKKPVQQAKTQTAPKTTVKPKTTAKPTVKMCDICNKTLSQCDYGGVHPKCQTCGKWVDRCEYAGNHPKCFVCGKLQAECEYGGNHPTCKNCGELLTKCEYHGNHPKCNTCGNLLKQCEYKGKHGTLNNHEWVDLGLPSGTKWATMNIGATSPSDYGNYYAWGETSTKSNYDWDNLKYCLDRKGEKFSKYVTDRDFGMVDGKRELEMRDDVAFVNWGQGWRMPSYDQIKELKEYCNWIWTSMDGHNGYKIVGSNSNSLFLPATGWRGRQSSIFVGSVGNYWTRSLYLDYDKDAFCIHFNGSMLYGDNLNFRNCGFTVRAVVK